MKNLKLILFLMFTFFYLGIMQAIASDPGSSALTILETPIGTRTYSMGDTGVSIADDSEAVYINPAGLLQLKASEFGGVYYNGFCDTMFIAAQYAHPFLKDSGTIGFSIISMNSGEIDLNYSTGLTERLDGESTMVFSGSYAYQILRKIKMGVNLKIINSKFLENNSTTAAAGDIGILTDFLDEKVNAGLVINNIGSKAKYLNVSHSLPVGIKFGASTELNIKEQYPLLLAFQLNRLSDNRFIFNFGTEFEPFTGSALRAGYQIGEDTSLFTFGMGVKVKDYKIDYAISPQEISTTHRISFMIKM